MSIPLASEQITERMVSESIGPHRAADADIDEHRRFETAGLFDGIDQPQELWRGITPAPIAPAEYGNFAHWMTSCCW